MHEIIHQITGEEIKPFTEADWWNNDYNCEQCWSKDGYLRFVIEEEYGHVIVGVDAQSVFNKYSQCPIFFGFNLEKPELPRRTNKALLKALTHLRTKEGADQSATFNFPFFGDDLTREYHISRIE